TATLLVNASGGMLDAWIDFNRDGLWSAAEQIFTDVALTSGDNLLSFTIPAGASPGTTYARFRASSAGGLAPTGPASDGEGEDYKVRLASGGAAVVTLPPGGGTTDVSVVGADLVVGRGGIPLFQVPNGSIASLTVNGTTSASDTLLVAFGAANPNLSGGLTFHGGSASEPLGNALILLGGTFTTVTYNYTNANDGDIQLDPDGPGGIPATVISYTA